jgi:hypothetical protein
LQKNAEMFAVVVCESNSIGRVVSSSTTEEDDAFLSFTMLSFSAFFNKAIHVYHSLPSSLRVRRRYGMYYYTLLV